MSEQVRFRNDRALKVGESFKCGPCLHCHLIVETEFVYGKLRCSICGAPVLVSVVRIFGEVNNV